MSSQMIGVQEVARRELGRIGEFMDERDGAYLSAWEIDFIEDMNAWDGKFTDKQVEKIFAIRDKLEEKGAI